MPAIVRLLTVIALVILGLNAVPLALHSWALLQFPYDLDPGEGIDVGAATVLLSGGQLYGDPTRYPFFGLNYPPVYQLAVAPFLIALGPSVIPGRVVSVAATVGLALLIFAGASLQLEVFPLSPSLPRQGGGSFS